MGKPPLYTIEIFEDIGRAFCIGLLDFYESNPISRLPLSSFKNLDGVKMDLIKNYNLILSKKRVAEIEENSRDKHFAL